MTERGFRSAARSRLPATAVLAATGARIGSTQATATSKPHASGSSSSSPSQPARASGAGSLHAQQPAAAAAVAGNAAALPTGDPDGIELHPDRVKAVVGRAKAAEALVRLQGAGGANLDPAEQYLVSRLQGKVSGSTAQDASLRQQSVTRWRNTLRRLRVLPPCCGWWSCPHLAHPACAGPVRAGQQRRHHRARRWRR